ncbi:MAG: flagellar hook-length control protein FliK [Alphaproteobacteria bacterium]|jgi:hypothetical protein
MPLPPANSAAAPNDKIPLHDTRRLPRGLPVSLVRAATRARTDDRVELTLDPVELGKVRFDFTTVNDRITINLSVERPETLDLLRRHAEVLRAEFRDAGFDGSNLNFSQWSQRGHAGSAASHPFTEVEAGVSGPGKPDPSPIPTNTATGQGLDLRL